MIQTSIPLQVPEGDLEVEEGEVVPEVVEVVLEVQGLPEQEGDPPSTQKQEEVSPQGGLEVLQTLQGPEVELAEVILMHRWLK